MADLTDDELSSLRSDVSDRLAKFLNDVGIPPPVALVSLLGLAGQILGIMSKDEAGLENGLRIANEVVRANAKALHQWNAQQADLDADSGSIH